MRALGQDPAQVWDTEMVFVRLRDVVRPQAVDRDKQYRLARLSEYRRDGQQEAESKRGF
jgi:hypothetical protein